MNNEYDKNIHHTRNKFSYYMSYFYLRQQKEHFTFFVRKMPVAKVDFKLAGVDLIRNGTFVKSNKLFQQSSFGLTIAKNNYVCNMLQHSFSVL